MSIRRDDSELNLYFGGRAAYLADIKAAIEALKTEIESGDIKQAHEGFVEIFGARTSDDAKRELEQYVAAYEINK